MHRFSGLALSLLFALSIASTSCKRAPEPTSSQPSSVITPAAPAAPPVALPTTPEVYPQATCEETNTLLRHPATATSASVDLTAVQERLTKGAEIDEDAAGLLKQAGPSAAPLTELIVDRILVAPAEETGRLLAALSSISPKATVQVASKLIDTGAAEPSRLKLSLAASSLISVGEDGIRAFLERAKDESIIPPPIRVSRMERMSSYPLPALELLFQPHAFCDLNPNDSGCLSLFRELLIARPALIPPKKDEAIKMRLARAEAALLRGEQAGDAWNSLIIDRGLPLEDRISSFEFVNPFVPAGVTIPAALALFREQPPLRAERSLALWLISRSGALRDPALLARLDAPEGETQGHLVARALIRMFAGDTRLAAEASEQLRVFGAAERNDLAALAQLALLKLGKFSLLTHPALAKQSVVWGALMAAKDPEALFALRADALKSANGIMLNDATLLWALGREAELATRLAAMTDIPVRGDAIRLADRLGPAGAASLATLVAAPPDVALSEAVTSLAVPLKADAAKAWVDLGIASPLAEVAAMKLSALSGYLPRQENLIPILLRERDGRKAGILRTLDATRLTQVLLLRQPELSRDRLAASRRELAPSDAGFSALGLILFAATADCTSPPEK